MLQFEEVSWKKDAHSHIYKCVGNERRDNLSVEN